MRILLSRLYLFFIFFILVSCIKAEEQQNENENLGNVTDHESDFVEEHEHDP